MWQVLLTGTQLALGSRLRKVTQESDFRHETECEVVILKDYVFVVEIARHNDVKLPDYQRAQMSYLIDTIVYHGFEIWQDG